MRAAGLKKETITKEGKRAVNPFAPVDC
jgi:hypothetical protein